MRNTTFDIDKGNLMGYSLDSSGYFIHWNAEEDDNKPLDPEYLKTLDQDTRSLAVMNYIVYNLNKIIISPKNAVPAQTPISMDKQKEAANRSPKAKNAGFFSPYNPAWQALMVVINRVGKTLTGIFAQDMKMYALSYYASMKAINDKEPWFMNLPNIEFNGKTYSVLNNLNVKNAIDNPEDFKSNAMLLAMFNPELINKLGNKMYKQVLQEIEQQGLTFTSKQAKSAYIVASLEKLNNDSNFKKGIANELKEIFGQYAFREQAWTSLSSAVSLATD